MYIKWKLHDWRELLSCWESRNINWLYIPPLVRYPPCWSRHIDFVSAFFFCFLSVCRKESFLSWGSGTFTALLHGTAEDSVVVLGGKHTPKPHMGPWWRRLNWLQAPTLPIGRVDISEWPCSFFPLMKELLPIYLVEWSYFCPDLSMHHSLEISDRRQVVASLQEQYCKENFWFLVALYNA